jgi:SP family galactose:H+ symporter-like MFS transporter
MPWLMACIASIGGLLFGYNTGVISDVLPQLNVAWKLTPLQEELAVSAVLFGAVVGAALVGIVADHIGRRDCIMATAALFVLGSFSGAMVNSPEAFIACRALVGVALGAVSLVAPLYIAEIAPARLRGRLVTVNQLGITCGIMLAYLVPYFLQGVQESWRYVLIIGTVPGVFLSIASLWLVESPRWLLAMGDEDEARANFLKIGDPEADAIIRDLKESLSQQSEDTWLRLAAPPIRLALFFVVGLFFFQQFVGINAFFYNASTILAHEGIVVSDGNLAVTIGLGLVNLVMTLVAMALVDRISRRLLLRIGLVGMGACLSVLAAGAGVLDDKVMLSSHLAVICLTGYVAFFSFSWGPLAWVIVAEVFPQRIRGAAMSIPVAAHWLFAIINASGAVFFLRELDDTGFYLIFAIVAFAGLLFLRKNFMETGGLALERIQRLFLERARALKKGNLVYYAITTVAGTGALLIGFNVGIIAGALVLITKEWGLDNLEQGVLVSALSAGLFIGQILAGKASDLFGRRYLLMSTAALFVAGAFVSALAQSFPTLVGARFLIGLTMGVAAVANSVYISEIAPPEIRGRLLTLSQATLAVGILLSYLAALVFETLPHGWRYMFAAAAAPSAVFGLGLLFLPESPRWLYSRGRRSASLRMLRGMGVSDPEAALEAMREGQDEEEEGGWRELLDPKLFPSPGVGHGIDVPGRIHRIRRPAALCAYHFPKRGHRLLHCLDFGNLRLGGGQLSHDPRLHVACGTDGQEAPGNVGDGDHDLLPGPDRGDSQPSRVEWILAPRFAAGRVGRFCGGLRRQPGASLQRGRLRDIPPAGQRGGSGSGVRGQQHFLLHIRPDFPDFLQFVGFCLDLLDLRCDRGSWRAGLLEISPGNQRPDLGGNRGFLVR